MKQIVQNYKTGQILLEEIPIPLLQGSGVIVRNYFSLISAGTEKTKIDMLKKNIISKAKSRPDLVKKVLDSVKNDGLINAAKAVYKKLDEFVPIGYSSCGKVENVSYDIKEIRIGDFIACAGGGYANHAEYIYVPKNLICKIPEGVDLIDASFTGVGSIAMQGVRLLSRQIGEKVLVIGLGLVGQLVVQILNASGISTFGIDVEKNKVEKGMQNGLNMGSLTNSADLDEKIKYYTKGKYFDGVIVSASTSSSSPVKLAGKYCREKGKVVVIGLVNMDIPREDYYNKEIDIVISRSYGPGRYDKFYEEKGIDYPYGYVRWTENRNMESFIYLIANKKINIKNLVSKIYDLSDYKKAYEELSNNKIKSDSYGIVFKYNVAQDRDLNRSKIRINKNKISDRQVNVSFIGAGSYAQKYLIPTFANNKDVNTYSIYSATGLSAKNIGKRYGFEYILNNVDDVFSDSKTNLIVISTRHDTHSKYIISALNNNKNVFSEKPLCINKEELEDIKKAYNKSSSILMVGFNRRFSTLIKRVKEIFNDRNYPLLINYRINAGEVDESHWMQDMDIGGGRIVGELCHFIDLVYFIINKKATVLYTSGINNNKEISLIDNVVVNMEFSDDSIASISYISTGSKLLFKEYIEVYGGGITVAIKDFKRIEIYGKNNIKKIKLRSQDKGQLYEINEFIDSLVKKGESPIPFNQIYNSTSNTLSVIDSLKTGDRILLTNE